MNTNELYDIIYSCPKKIWTQGKTLDAMLEDLFYGQTFRVMPSRQLTVSLCSRTFRDHVTDWGEKDGRRWFCVRVPALQFNSERLSSCLVQLWGNVLDYKGIRLEQLDPKLLHRLRPNRKRFVGEVFSQFRYPLFATVLKPSWGIPVKKRAKMAADFVALGGDLVKEDETYIPSLSQLVSNVSVVQEALDLVKTPRRGLGIYVPNITGWIGNKAAMKRLQDAGLRAAMVAFLTSGLDVVHDLAGSHIGKCILWGHRVGYECMGDTLSQTALVQFAFAAGLDAVHVGTPIIHQPIEVERAEQAVETLRSLSHMNGEIVLPIFSKTTRVILPELIERYGRQSILLGCGEFHKSGNPDWEPNKVQAWLNEGKKLSEE